MHTIIKTFGSALYGIDAQIIEIEVNIVSGPRIIYGKTTRKRHQRRLRNQLFDGKDECIVQSPHTLMKANPQKVLFDTLGNLIHISDALL